MFEIALRSGVIIVKKIPQILAVNSIAHLKCFTTWPKLSVEFGSLPKSLHLNEE